MSFQIIRDTPESPDQNWTLGKLFAGGYTFYTLELPWRKNQPNVSCIPIGLYQCVIAWSNRYKRLMPRLLGVPLRSGILVHPGNTTHDTQGCVLIGTIPGNQPGTVLKSVDAFTRFFDWLGVEMRTGRVDCMIDYDSGHYPFEEPRT